jgi:hypothetical protein
MLVRRWIAAIVLVAMSLSGGRAFAADIITVTIAPHESEIITSDLKRIRPAEAAELRFKATTPHIAQMFGSDLTVPRNRMRLTVIASARRVLSAMTGAQAIGPEAPPDIVKEIDRALADMGVTVEQFNLRYVFLPGYTP